MESYNILLDICSQLEMMDVMQVLQSFNVKNYLFHNLFFEVAT